MVFPQAVKRCELLGMAFEAGRHFTASSIASIILEVSEDELECGVIVDSSVRRAAVVDARAIARIYNEGIEDRVATFETAPRSASGCCRLVRRPPSDRRRGARRGGRRLRGHGSFERALLLRGKRRFLRLRRAERSQ